MTKRRDLAVAPPVSLSAGGQLEELLDESLEELSSAGQVCPVLSVPLLSSDAVAPELAAALGLGLAATTLATPHVLSAPAMTMAATAALTRDRLRVAP